ncbi:hypothetical protein Salat_2575800, partial [Sesamum alatum]
SVYVPKPCGAPPPATQAQSRIHLADPPSTKVPSQDFPESSPPRVIDHGASALPPPHPVDKGKFVFIFNSFEALKFPFSNPRVLIHAARKKLLNDLCCNLVCLRSYPLL